MSQFDFARFVLVPFLVAVSCWYGFIKPRLWYSISAWIITFATVAWAFSPTRGPELSPGEWTVVSFMILLWLIAFGSMKLWLHSRREACEQKEMSVYFFDLIRNDDPEQQASHSITIGAYSEADLRATVGEYLRDCWNINLEDYRIKITRIVPYGEHTCVNDVLKSLETEGKPLVVEKL